MLITSFLVVILLLYFVCLLTIDVYMPPNNLSCIHLISNEQQNFKCVKWVILRCHTLQKFVLCNIQMHANTLLTALRHLQSVTNSTKTLTVSDIFYTYIPHIIKQITDNKYQYFNMYTSISKFAMALFHNG